jgi:hypothetical protein
VEPRLLGSNGEKKLTELPWLSATSGWGKASVNKNVEGGPIIVNNQPAAYGIGAHSPSVIEYDLPAGYTRFKATAGLEKRGANQSGGATVRFYILTTDPRPADAGAGLPVAVTLSDIGFTGSCQVRDLWEQTDVGTVTGEFSAPIRSHGAGLYRISPVP